VLHKHAAVGAAAHTFSLVLALLFSLHSFIAGLALGIQSHDSASSAAILIAILGHKFVEALSLASNFVREGVGLSTSASVLFVYCCMTPAGILTGRGVLSIGKSAATAEALISGLAAGSFTFLAAHELTHTAATSRLSKRTRAALAFAGVGCMAVLAIWV
jgi:zinc transporter 1/2/3